MKRNGVRKFVLALAVASAIAAVATLAVALWALTSLGGSHVATASLFATAFFFACCAVVIYFMSVPPRSLPERGDGSGGT